MSLPPAGQDTAVAASLPACLHYGYEAKTVMGPAVHISIRTPIQTSRSFQRRDINTTAAAEKRRLPHLTTHYNGDKATGLEEAAGATE